MTMANKYGRNAKLILFLLAESTKRQSHISRLLDIMHGLTTIYNVRLVNEKSLYATYIQESCEKLVIILFNEDGLGNRQFRECLRTSLAAKLNIIGVLDEGVTRERVLGFFSFNNKRKQMLEEIITSAFCFEKDSLFKATPLVDRIQQLCRPVSSRISDRPRLPKITEPNVSLEACLKSKKVVLKPMYRAPARPLFSCTLTRKTELPILKAQKSSTGQIRSFPRMKNGQNASVTYPRIEISQGLPTQVIKKRTNSTTSVRSKTPVKQLTCPIIEISQDDDLKDMPDTPDVITETQDRLPWTITTTTKDDSKTKRDDFILEIGDEYERRLSFDYVSKTYVVFDPKKKKTLHVNFPNGCSMLKRESLHDVLSNVSSRRNSFLWSNSASSSTDEINLECVFDSVNILDSPIPSPTMRRSNVIYQNPLPVYPDEICFPPVEKFPCDTLQMRRPSVFDVLLH